MPQPLTVCPQCGLEYASGEVFCPNDGARLAPRRDSLSHKARREGHDPLLGQTLDGRYRIVRKIGEGGMGIVYEAEHVIIEKRVGLKVLREDFSRRADVVERFRQEAKSASKIGHEHIVDISDFGVTPRGAHYFVMELLTGHDLATELAREGALSPRRVIGIALQCAEALGAAHAKGIIHRDMKPENIFLVARPGGADFVKIVDFGIAKMSDVETEGQSGQKLTKTGMIFGTPEYMSPEQAGGKKLDHRVDIYALGIIMYELLCGRVPFVGDTFMGILTQHLFEQAPRLSGVHVPPELEGIVFKALAKSPDDRYQSMDELAHDLAQALAGASDEKPAAHSLPGTLTHAGHALEARPVAAPARLLVAGPATELTPERRAPRGALLWAGAGAALVALAAAALFAFSGSDAVHPRSLPPAPPPATVHVAAKPPSPAPSSAAQPAPPTPAPPAHVSVRVDTSPADALVLVDGREVCSGTPCQFSTERGQQVTIEAQKRGYRSASSKLVPEGDLSQVTLTLVKRAASRPAASKTRQEGDLKIPDAFGRPR